MSTFKQVWLSIKRRKSKSIIMFLIVFLLGNVFCAATSIVNSIDQLETDFKNQMGMKITISKNDEIYNYFTYEELEEDVNSLISNIEEIDREGFLKYNDYQYSLTGLFSENLIFNNKYIKVQPCSLPFDMHLIGLTETQFIDAIDQKVKLIKGRYFSEEEINNSERVLILSDKFTYNGNNINVGDVIPIEKIVYDQELNEIHKEISSYTVVGIFSKLPSLINHDSYELENYDTHIYIPYSTLFHEYKKINDLYNSFSNSKNLLRLQLYMIKIKLSNINDDKEFYTLFNLENPLIYSKNSQSLYNLLTTEDIYKKMVVPLNSLTKISNMLRITSSITVLILFSLCIFIFLKDKKYEIGVLYALGENKIQIVLNQILEILIIGMLAIVLSMFSGVKFGELYSKGLIENQIEASQYVYVEEQSQKELLERYTVEINIEYITMVFTGGITIIAISSLVPIMYILHLEPKKVLL